MKKIVHEKFKRLTKKLLIIGPDSFIPQSSPDHSPQPRVVIFHIMKSLDQTSVLLSVLDTMCVFHYFFSQSHLSTISTTRLKIIQCLSYGERCPGSNGFLRGPLPKMTWVSSQTNVLVKFMYQF